MDIHPIRFQNIQEKKKRIYMSITRIYRDRDNNIKVEKFSFEEVKKDLTKFFSHDNGINNKKDNINKIKNRKDNYENFRI